MEAAAIRALLEAAFATDDGQGFAESDWRHALGGLHFIAELDGEVVGHAAVVERLLHVAGRPVRTGYVEAVAVRPDLHGCGLGTALMRDVGEYVRERFELGALSTGRHSFYGRLGWQVWRGSAFVRGRDGEMATPDDDGDILVLDTPHTPALDPGAPIAADWRDGDVW